MRERWEVIPDFPDYTVSNFGNIHNIKSDMPRRTSVNQFGIIKISLYRGRELHTRSVAVMVAEVFCEGQTDIFNTPIHLDGDRHNCGADNLMWRPRWYAVEYLRQFDQEQFHNATAPVVEINSGDEFDSTIEACTTLGLHYDDVYRSYLNERPGPLTRHEFRLLA